MATDLRTGILEKEEYLNNARIMYSPVILALQNKEFHNVDISKVKFKEYNVEDDSIVAEVLTKEATEKAHIKARGVEKTFNIFVKGAKFIKSLADGAVVDLQKIHNRVLRDYMIIFDKDGLHGDGGNNGLLTSNDPYYLTNGNHEIPAVDGNGFNRVQDINALMNTLKLQVGEKTSSSDVKIFVYGADLIKFLGSITQDNETTVRDILKKAYPEAMFIEIPSLALNEGDGNGFVVVSDDATTLHLTTEPTIKKQGENEENEYYYANYVTGSLQVTPDLEGAIIKQPITFA
nr:MAG TPA: protein of unknown function (DUF2184) [Caudoviricetes sp.]